MVGICEEFEQLVGLVDGVRGWLLLVVSVLVLDLQSHFDYYF
jgi:hypothetical protein